jgi:hypothetical protein
MLSHCHLRGKRLARLKKIQQTTIEEWNRQLALFMGSVQDTEEALPKINLDLVAALIPQAKFHHQCYQLLTTCYLPHNCNHLSLHNFQ